jgi:hypothetical protein
MILVGFDPSKADDTPDTEIVYHKKDEEQLDRLRKAVAGVFLFRSLDSSQLLKVLNALFEVLTLALFSFLIIVICLYLNCLLPFRLIGGCRTRPAYY